MTQVTDQLTKVPFLAVLPASDVEALAGAAGLRQFRRGQTIFQKDDPGQTLYVIDDGAVRIYLPSPQGTDLTIAVLGPGDFFGELALLHGGRRSASATALENTGTVTLDRADFIDVIQTRPRSVMAVLEVMTQRLREADEMAADMAFLDVNGRLAKKLLELAATHGVPRDRGVLLDLSLTQEELANMVGVTRESVNRRLAMLRRRGIIGSEGRRFLLRDIDGLRRFVA